ncbi:MAG: redox-sensing transcriptional repressor [Acidimicrobiales bacterium]|jgi:redox-sensing transcriptional repressor
MVNDAGVSDPDDGWVSAATVGRLPHYLRALIDLASENEASVSSDRLSELTAVNPATVRRDLASLDISGTRGLGYDVKYLVHEVSVVLGLSQDWAVAIIGAGNLGRALANHQGLSSRGFPVRAIVDVDPSLVGSDVAGLAVDHLDDLGAVVAERDVAVGVIATPAEEAQHAADLLIEAGVLSILNFTSTSLVVPDHVQVRRVDLATELQILSFYQQRTAGARSGAGVPLGVDPGLEVDA